MRPSTITSTALAVPGVLAYPQLLPGLVGGLVKGNPIIPIIETLAINVVGPNPNDKRYTTWKAPGPNDIRGPCPVMNTMANHGFINHSGRDLYVPDIMRGLAQGMNIGFDFSGVVAGSHCIVAPNPLSLTFDMDVLATHNFPIEHDMSYSREDFYFNGDVSTFSPEAWNQTWNAFEDGDLVTIKGLANARNVRKADSQARNPDFVFGPRGVAVNTAEAAIILHALGESPLAMTAPKSYFKMVFEQEKLPYELGWRPSRLPITFADIFSTAGLILLASNDTLGEGVQMTLEAYKDALAAVDPATGFLANVGKNLPKRTVNERQGWL